MPAKLVTARLEAARAADAAFISHLEAATAGLVRWLEPELRPGERLPDLRFYLELLQRALARRRAALAEADDIHEIEKRRTAAPRRERDEAAAAVRARLVRLRSIFTDCSDLELASAMLRMRGRLPEEPRPIAMQGASTVAALRVLVKRPPPPKRLPHKDWDIAAEADDLEAKVRRLEDALDRVGRDRKDIQLLHYRKNQAIRDFDDTFRRTTHLLEGHLDAAGMLWAAKKVRTKRRHRRKKPKPAAEE